MAKLSHGVSLAPYKVLYLHILLRILPLELLRRWAKRKRFEDTHMNNKLLRGTPVGATVILYSRGYHTCYGEARCVEKVPLNVAIPDCGERLEILRSWWPQKLGEREQLTFEEALKRSEEGQLHTPMFRYLNGQNREEVAIGARCAWTFPDEG